MTPPPLFEILDYRDTPLGSLCLRRRELLAKRGTIVTEVTLNHEFLMSSYNTASERALATSALALHRGTELRVLIGGLGLGYTAGEVLKSQRVAHVEVVEFLPEVIDWLERRLLPLSEELAGDARLHVGPGDIYQQLLGPPGKTHDVILIDVDHSPREVLHPANRAFYEIEGIRRARDHLAPAGVLAVWSSAEDRAFARALGEVFPDVSVEVVAWHNELIDEAQRDHLFLARLESRD